MASKKNKSAGNGPSVIAAGDALTPNIESLRSDMGVDTDYLFWVGVLPTCPVDSIDLAGINFPKLNELLLPPRPGTQNRVRHGVIGALVRLSEARMHLMIERLPRTVIRFFEDAEEQREEPSTGMNVGDAHIQARRGMLITIPTPAEIEQRRKAGRSTRVYRPTEFDEPAARYMFAKLCADQVKGERSQDYPATIAEKGLSWPTPLDAELAEFL